MQTKKMCQIKLRGRGPKQVNMYHSAAFDVVNKNILQGKFEAYGFKENLTSRIQQVYIDGSLSEPLMIDIGVLQGSILGPLLHVIYANDLPEVHINRQTNVVFTICHVINAAVFALLWTMPLTVLVAYVELS